MKKSSSRVCSGFPIYTPPMAQSQQPKKIRKMDLRYTIPPVVNFFLFLFFASWNWEVVVSFISGQPFSVLKMTAEILAVMFLLLFLFTSAETRLTLSPISLRFGHFSIALTASLAASLFFPPPLFWAVYLLIIFSSPLHRIFFQLLQLFFRLFSGALNSIPTYTIDIVAQNEETPNSGSAPHEDEIEVDLELGLGLGRLG